MTYNQLRQSATEILQKRDRNEYEIENAYSRYDAGMWDKNTAISAIMDYFINMENVECTDEDDALLYEELADSAHKILNREMKATTAEIKDCLNMTDVSDDEIESSILELLLAYNGKTWSDYETYKTTK